MSQDDNKFKLDPRSSADPLQKDKELWQSGIPQSFRNGQPAESIRNCVAAYISAYEVACMSMSGEAAHHLGQLAFEAQLQWEIHQFNVMMARPVQVGQIKN
jgi:hypothetical protein